MNYHVAKGLKIRMVTILALIGIGAAGIIARAVQIQILEAPRLKEIATRQHQDIIEIRATRGSILDARGEALAVSRQEAQVYARPEQIKDTTTAAKSLARILELDRRKLKARLETDQPFVWIARSATLEQAEAIKVLAMDGVGLLPANRRLYPGGSLAANIIGFAGVDGTGLEGLEFKYEKLLAGKPIRLWLERDARGNSFALTDLDGGGGVLSAVRERPGRAGKLFDVEARGTTLMLTILRPLQYLVEKELENGVKRAGAKAGCVVAMDPESGAILAMASYPTFDPNRFSDYSQENFRNRCVQSAFEPGSTFKVFITAAAIEAGVINNRDRFYCENGSYFMGGETISDIKAHGWLSVKDIIVKSSNIGASKIGERLGSERMYQAIQQLGFGMKTGLDFPGESPGLVRSYDAWSQVAVGTISFGQGIAVTPLQMVTALSALANGGSLMRPYLVEGLVRPDGTEVVYQGPEEVGTVFDLKTTTAVTRFMVAVTGDDGTGEKARVPGYTVAGKTGTAQKPKQDERGYAEGKYVSSFMGFLPAERPRLAMIVILDEPRPEAPWGGEVAAPVFQAIAGKAMVLLKVPSEDEDPLITGEENRSGSPLAFGKESESRIRRWEQARSWKSSRAANRSAQGKYVPELRGLTLRRALLDLQGLPLQVEVSGTGVVAAQEPEPGTPIQGQGVVRIRLEASL